MLRFLAQRLFGAIGVLLVVSVLVFLLLRADAWRSRGRHRGRQCHGRTDSKDPGQPGSRPIAGDAICYVVRQPVAR